MLFRALRTSDRAARNSTACQWEWQAVRDWAREELAGLDAYDLGGV
jgi:hypothetical protein